MTSYSVSEAARAVGRNRSSIRRAIARGAISAVRDAATAEWRITADELHRVYPLARAPGAAPEAARGTERDGAPARASDSEARAALAEARLADAQDQISDLRRRLDASEAERREQAARIVALLTDQRAVPARRSWWRWR